MHTSKRSTTAVIAALFAATFLGAASARADIPSWVKCEPVVTDNVELVPNKDGTFPADPAIPYENDDSTKWSTDGLEINVSVNGKAKTQFFIKGINYEPTQIGGSADFSPFNDYFYTNTNDTWSALWQRDVPLMRDLGVNAIRTYGVWKWEPGFAQDASGTRGIGTAQYWEGMNWKASAAGEKDTQLCVANSFLYKHPTHDAFLDAMWNGGTNPIYVWIGISIPIDAVNPNTPADSLADYRQFYLHTAKWLAKKYGDHPAVMGFVIGNEIDSDVTVTSSVFWRLINDMHQVVKASAPNKLTAVTLHDTDLYTSTITSGEYKGDTGPQVYQPDVWGLNPYSNPSANGAAFDKYRTHVVTGCKQPGGAACTRPLMWGEWGVPSDTHEVSSQPSKLYPLPWTGPNFIWDPNPGPAQCLAANTQGPPPGSGGDPDQEFKRQDTSAVLMPKRSGAYKLPNRLAKYYTNSTFQAGDELPAALQADWLASFWQVTTKHRADNDAPVAENDLSSGGFVFEFRDEWWKSGYVTFQGISGPATDCQPGCGKPGCQPGPANTVFPGGWGDEEWFGVHGAKPNNRKATDPVVDGATGKLNGGPDVLLPRAAIAALCTAYKGDGCAAVWKARR